MGCCKQVDFRLRVARGIACPCWVLWQPVVEFTNLVRRNNWGLGASTVCEECINVAKNNKRKTTGKRFRKPEWIMRTVLASDLWSKRHKGFKQVEVKLVKSKKCERVTRALFQEICFLI